MNLSLQKNCIETIEAICLMWMPSLEVLDLCNKCFNHSK